jgi:ribonuclease-3
MTRANRAARHELSERIGYVFGDETLLERAVTHVSSVRDRSRGSSYQRLEFLGDRVLGLAVAEMLFAAFPKADEGELSKRLVSGGRSQRA